MNSHIKSIVLAVLFLFSTAPTYADFSGPYAVGNWTQTVDGGSINTGGAPGSVSLTSSDVGGGTPTNASSQVFTIAAVADGLVSFDWAYKTSDSLGPSFDPFDFLLNASFQQLSDDFGADEQNGSFSWPVSAGDVFGFRAFSQDSCCGPATTEVSNFTAPVPEPEIYAMMGMGLGLLGWLGRRKKLKEAAAA